MIISINLLGTYTLLHHTCFVTLIEMEMKAIPQYIEMQGKAIHQYIVLMLASNIAQDADGRFTPVRYLMRGY